MAEMKSYTIFFTFNVSDHSLRFPMRAEVEGAESGVYTITNIRQVGQNDEALFPPIQIHKKDSTWLLLGTTTTGQLCTIIGEAIDERERSA